MEVLPAYQGQGIGTTGSEGIPMTPTHKPLLHDTHLFYLGIPHCSAGKST